MKELGFIIDKNGKVTRFGEIKQNDNEFTRKNIHDYSFYDEVENTNYFKSLNLDYEKECGLHGKFVNFSLQGIICAIHSSAGSNSYQIIYLPKYITEEQKSSLKDLYEDLCNHETYQIAIYDDVQNHTLYEDLDEVYNMYEIKNKISNKR